MAAKKKIRDILENIGKSRNLPRPRYILPRLSRMVKDKSMPFIYKGVYSGHKKYEAWYLRDSNLVFKLLKKRGLVEERKGRIFLTLEGAEFVRELTKREWKIKIIKGRKIKLTVRYKNILSKMKKISGELTPNTKYDQAPLTADSVVYKIRYAEKRGDISGKAVVCVGDDDLLSVALALTGKPKEILAVDIDPKLLKLIKHHTKNLGVPVKTLKHDLTKPIPKKYRNKYDTFMCWPPETLLGYSLFVSRGVEFLKSKKGSIGYPDMAPTEFHPLEILAIKENFEKMSLEVTDYVEKYLIGIYYSVPIRGKKVFSPNYIDLVRLKAVKRPKPIFSRFKRKIPF